MPSSGFVKSEFIDQQNNLSIYVIDIKEMSQELKNKIDEHILRVWEGRNLYGTTINDVKLKINNFLRNKLNENPEQNTLNDIYMGAVAEFFIHIFLNDIGLEQECTFKNLEERSIKKGLMDIILMIIIHGLWRVNRVCPPVLEEFIKINYLRHTGNYDIK